MHDPSRDRSKGGREGRRGESESPWGFRFSSLTEEEGMGDEEAAAAQEGRGGALIKP